MSRVDRNNRADLVRRRRREQANKRLTDSAVLATRTVTPITSRTRVLPASPRRPVAGRRRERSVSMPGIELQMPAISFSGPGSRSRFLSFALCLILGGALYAAGASPTFRAAPPQVYGNARVPAEEIAAALGMENSQVFSLIPADLEKQLRLSLPELKAVRVTVGLPNEVFVEVVERTPVVEWHQGDSYTWIDETGVAFRPRGVVDGVLVVQALNAPQAVDVPEDDPLAPRPFISTDLVAAIRTLAPQAPQGVGLMYDERYGLGWNDPRGWQAFFGSDGRNMEMRLKVYQSMVEMVSAKGITPFLMSVQYPSAPYYRVSNTDG